MKSKLLDQLTFAIENLQLAFDNVLSQGDIVAEYQKSVPIAFMQCIAQVRLGFCFASEMFKTYFCYPAVMEKLSREEKEGLQNLKDCTKKIVEAGVMREPLEFITKQLVREYGMPMLEKLSKMTEFLWLKPESVVCFIKLLEHISYKYMQGNPLDPYIVAEANYNILKGLWVPKTKGIQPTVHAEEIKVHIMSHYLHLHV